MDDLFKELLEVPAIPKTTGMEKLIREIGILLDSSGFALYFKRNPLTSELQMYDIKLARKSKKDENKAAATNFLFKGSDPFYFFSICSSN